MEPSNELFWQTYLHFPMDDLIQNIDDHQLQLQIENEVEQEEILEGIDEYLNKDIFSVLMPSTNSSPPIPIPIQLHTEQTNYPYPLQLVFHADNVPPFHFLT